MSDGSKKLDGLWTLQELEKRARAWYSNPDPNFRNWVRSLALQERRYVIGYLVEIVGMETTQK